MVVSRNGVWWCVYMVVSRKGVRCMVVSRKGLYRKGVAMVVSRKGVWWWCVYNYGGV